MKIALGSDRNGVKYKEAIKLHLISKGNSICDEGPYDDKYPVDYPIYGERVGRLVSSGSADCGIVVCATGTGIMIACNKVHGIRCGMGYSDDAARLMRQHNNANIIAFGQNHMELCDVLRRIDIFLNTDYLGGYHDTRIQQISRIECGLEITQTPFFDV